MIFRSATEYNNDDDDDDDDDDDEGEDSCGRGHDVITCE
jgi:hypothetical protein